MSHNATKKKMLIDHCLQAIFIRSMVNWKKKMKKEIIYFYLCLLCGICQRFFIPFSYRSEDVMININVFFIDAAKRNEKKKE